MLILIFVVFAFSPSLNMPFFPSVSGGDYVGVSRVELTFEIGDRFACHSITIIRDEICEYNEVTDIPIENFVSYLDYGSGVRPISIVPERTMVIITDTTEAECGEYFSIQH